MKKTRRKNILRGIKGSINRFLSILFIVALGSGFMAGLTATSPDMYETADEYMDSCDYYDIDVKSTYGFTVEDAAKISEMEDVSGIQCANVFDMILLGNVDKKYTSRVFAFMGVDGESSLNRVVLKEGRLPINDNECVVQVTMGRYSDGNLKIGDTLTVSSESENYDDICDSALYTELSVVGFVESPMCVGIVPEPSTEGTGRVQLEVYVCDDFFGNDYYSDIYVTLCGAKEENTFSEEYNNIADNAKEQIDQLANIRTPIRTAEMKQAAKDKIAETREFIAGFEKTVQIGAALARDTAGRLVSNATLCAMLQSADPKLAQMLGEVQQSVADTLRNTDTQASEKAIMAAYESVESAEAQIDKMAECVWIGCLRADSVGYSSYDSNVGKVAALSKIFPAFFFIVALLVALTTMTRLVEENRTQIGTLKALGFTNVQVLGEYLLYSLSSSVLGCILGFAVGFRLFPSAISSAYSMMFILPKTVTPFRPDIALWVAPVTIGSIILATLFACYGEFYACPAELMRPKAPAVGKRIWLEHITFVWKRLSFTHKVTCRNLFRYKKRFFMTVIGVAGCSALLLTGFGLRDSINDIVDKQFGEVYKYEISVMLRDKDTALEGTRLYSTLENDIMISDWMPYSEQQGKVMFADVSGDVTVCVPRDADRISNFVALRDRVSGNAVDFPEQGVVLTEKLCETLGVSVGQIVTVENSDGVRFDFVIEGITENYITSFAYMSSDTYSNAFGQDAEFSTILCRLAPGSDADSTVTSLMSDENVTYVSSSVSLKDSFNDSIKSINGVVLVLILSAGLLCIVVLYNLTNVNICERRKELATIRVLGFHKKEVERYIFRETNVLSLIGSVVGLFVGIWLHSFVVHTVEIDQVMFGRNIYPQSFIFAVAISMLFTFIVNKIMRFRVRKIDMVEAMKAND